MTHPPEDLLHKEHPGHAEPCNATEQQSGMQKTLLHMGFTAALLAAIRKCCHHALHVAMYKLLRCASRLHHAEVQMLPANMRAVPRSTTTAQIQATVVVVSDRGAWWGMAKQVT